MKEKETHELIFSWLSSLAVVLVGAYARRRRRSRATWRHTPNNKLTETCSLSLPCTSLILDIHVMINWHLSNQVIRWPVSRDHIAGSSLQFIEVTCLFLSGPLTKCWFSIGSRAHVRLTCWKWGRIVRKPVNASSGLKVNWINYNFFFYTNVFCCFVLCIWWLLKLKTEGQTIYRKPYRKVRKLRSKFWSYTFRLA